MHASPDKSRTIQTLTGLMERLSAPDLTAAEANELRPRLMTLLQSIETPAPGRECGLRSAILNGCCA